MFVYRAHHQINPFVSGGLRHDHRGVPSRAGRSQMHVQLELRLVHVPLRVVLGTGRRDAAAYDPSLAIAAAIGGDAERSAQLGAGVVAPVGCADGVEEVAGLTQRRESRPGAGWGCVMTGVRMAR